MTTPYFARLSAAMLKMKLSVEQRRELLAAAQADVDHPEAPGGPGASSGSRGWADAFQSAGSPFRDNGDIR